MTGQQMIDAFDVYWDKVANLSAQGYIESEKLLFLNNAQDTLVKERVFGKNFQPPAFDQNAKRAADIRPLVVTGLWAPTVDDAYGNSVRVNYYSGDLNFLYLTKVTMRVTRTNPTVTAQYLPCRKITVDDAGNFRATDFNRLWFKNPVFFEMNENGIYIIGDYYTSSMNSARLTYVRKPVPITATIGEFNSTYGTSWMSLEPHTHQEIVNIAVDDALDVSGDQRLQSSLALEQTKTK